MNCQTGRQSSEDPGGIPVRGTIKFINVEGGCWYLETKAGKRFELAGEDLQQILINDLEVELLIKPMRGVASICQVGDLVEVLSIIRVGHKE
jgi:hypothetical protein